MSFYDDASLVFLAGGAAGKDGKAYNLKPVEELSSTEVVINGGFSIDGPGTDGELDTSYGNYGWNTVSPSAGTQEGTTTISNGVLKLTNALGETDSRAYATDGVSSRNVITTNTYYKLVYTIVENNGCTSFKIYNAGGVQEDAPSSVGTHTVSLRNTSNQLFLFFNKTESSSISIDNVSIREITNQAADFTFSRGTNLTATRVGKDGNIEKGNEQLARNTTWVDAGDETAPTGWTDFTSGTGTYDVTSVAGQIQFVTDASSRSFLISQTFTAKSNYVLSVTVDSVTTACDVRQMIGISNSTDTTTISYFKDGAVISGFTKVEEGSRYSVSINVDTTSAKTFRFGIGASSAHEGDITLSKPQITYGLAPVDYVENTSTTSTKNFGLLEDEPRFDYSGGGCPALLMEPNRTNYINHSEYGGGYEVVDSNLTVTDNTEVSPEGYSNAVKIEDISTSSATQAVKFGALESGSVVGRTFTGSLYIKPVNSGDVGGNVYLSIQRRTGDFEGLTQTIEIDSADWKRYEITYTFTGAGAGNQTGCDFKILKTGTPIDDIYVYGVQLEEGAFATSYIPTYGSSATRAKEGFTDSYDQINTLDLSSSGLNGEDVSWFFELKNNQSIARDSSATTIRVSSNTSNLGSLRIYRASSGVKQLTVYLQDTSSPSVPLVANGYEMTSENPKVLVKRTWSTGRIQVYVDGVSVIDEIDLDYNAWYKLELGGAGSTLELKQVLAFPTVLSNNDSEILTGATSYSSFADMATSTALNYTIYE